MDVAFHAAAQVERQPKMQRKGLPQVVAILRIALREIRDRLRLALFHNLKVADLQACNGRALLVGKDNRKLNEVDAGLEPLLPRPTERQRPGHRQGRRHREGCRDREREHDVATKARRATS